ncbi:MAG: hypothetical protein Tsb0019_24900 [Roseibium sp.]
MAAASENRPPKASAIGERAGAVMAVRFRGDAGPVGRAAKRQAAKLAHFPAVVIAHPCAKALFAFGTGSLGERLPRAVSGSRHPAAPVARKK